MGITMRYLDIINHMIKRKYANFTIYTSVNIYIYIYIYIIIIITIICMD